VATDRHRDAAQPGSPRALAEDWHVAFLAYNSICERRNGANNKEARAAKARLDEIAQQLAAKVLGVREAGALADGLDRRDAPRAQRPDNSVLRTGWVKPITVNTEELWPEGERTSRVWELAKKIADARFALLSEAVRTDTVIVSDPTVRLTLSVTARTVPMAMYHGAPSASGYGSYLPEGMEQIHWHEQRGIRRNYYHEER
jgi:hypothetical protein